MPRIKMDVKNSWRTLKSASLMGPRNGPPTAAEADREGGKITRVRPYDY